MGYLTCLAHRSKDHQVSGPSGKVQDGRADRHGRFVVREGARSLSTEKCASREISTDGQAVHSRNWDAPPGKYHNIGKLGVIDGN